MPATSRPVLSEYVRAGFALVPIPEGQKGPATPRWNTREMCIADPEIAEFLDGNVGLAHAYSGTCAIDIDDLARCTAWLAERSIDLPALLEAPDAVRIESRPGRAKLLYRVTPPLPSFKLPCGLELRCAASTGLTLQDVLPPSIHPDTGKPYQWAFGSPAAHWSALPALPGNLLSLWQGLIASLPKEGAKAQSKPQQAKAADLRKLLAGRNPDTGYDEWLAVGMALHHETRGADIGLLLWNEWSAKGKKYKGLGDLDPHWRSFKVDRENPITLASLRTETAADASEFDEVPEEAATPGASPAGRGAAGTHPPRTPPLVIAQGGTGADRDRALATLRSVRRGKLGTIEARISNIAAVLGVPEACGVDLALDEFRDSIMISPHGKAEWRPFSDTDYTSLRIWLETAGNTDPVPLEMMRQAVLLVAEQHRMDTAKLWLESLEWDGVPRIEHFCPRYLGTIDADYERAVGLYLWTALAGRVLAPGCQVDMVPVFISAQGIGKTTTIQAMCPSHEHYVDLRLDEPDDTLARKTRGVLIAELSELRGLRQTDVERVKAFVTRRYEKWVPKYREFAIQYPRRFVMIGSTNDEEFLPPDTEHRRWLPLHTPCIHRALIARDRDQLWAEGAVRWAVDGIAWSHVDTLAAPARSDASAPDAWEEDVARYVFANPSRSVKLQEVIVNAVGVDPRQVNRSHELRVGRILRALGYVRRTVREPGGRFAKVWEPVTLT